MSRLLRLALPFLVAALTAACAGHETARPSGTAARPPDPAASPLAGSRFSLMNAKLKMPPLPESGTASESQIAVPLNTADPRYAGYFAELKRRIEDKWSYPAEASRKGQSGQGELRLVLRKDGSVHTVEIVKSSGVELLDTYIRNAIHMAQPFPPIPAALGDDVLPISLNFSYVLKRAQ